MLAVSFTLTFFARLPLGPRGRNRDRSAPPTSMHHPTGEAGDARQLDEQALSKILQSAHPEVRRRAVVRGRADRLIAKLRAVDS